MMLTQRCLLLVQTMYGCPMCFLLLFYNTQDALAAIYTLLSLGYIAAPPILQVLKAIFPSPSLSVYHFFATVL